jgi:hypothetical protein
MNEKTQGPRSARKRTGAPGPERIWYVGDAFAMGMSVDEVFELTKIDRGSWCRSRRSSRSSWSWKRRRWTRIDRDELLALKQKGFSDRRLARQLKTTDKVIRERRRAWACARCTSAWTPARPSSPPTPPTCIRPTRTSARPSPPTTRRSWCWAAAPTASARASSSTIAACTPRWPCARTATRPSWSTATPRPSRPTTTPPTACTSSRSRWKTCWRSSTRKSRWA